MSFQIQISVRQHDSNFKPSLTMRDILASKFTWRQNRKYLFLFTNLPFEPVYKANLLTSFKKHSESYSK